jgi:hypothetical protein
MQPRVEPGREGQPRHPASIQQRKPIDHASRMPRTDARPCHESVPTTLVTQCHEHPRVPLRLRGRFVSLCNEARSLRRRRREAKTSQGDPGCASPKAPAEAAGWRRTQICRTSRADPRRVGPRPAGPRTQTGATSEANGRTPSDADRRPTRPPAGPRPTLPPALRPRRRRRRR